MTEKTVKYETNEYEDGIVFTQKRKIQKVFHRMKINIIVLALICLKIIRYTVYFDAFWYLGRVILIG